MRQVSLDTQLRAGHEAYYFGSRSDSRTRNLHLIPSLLFALGYGIGSDPSCYLLVVFVVALTFLISLWCMMTAGKKASDLLEFGWPWF